MRQRYWISAFIIAFVLGLNIVLPLITGKNAIQFLQELTAKQEPLVAIADDNQSENKFGFWYPEGQDPSEYYNDSGTWKPINLTIKPYNQNGYDYFMNQSWYTFFLKTHSNWGDGFKFEINGSSIIYQPSDYSYRNEYGSQDYLSSISDVSVAIDNTNYTATYSNVFPNVNLSYQMQPNIVKESYIINSLPRAPAGYLGTNVTLDFGGYIKYGTAHLYVDGIDKTGQNFFTQSEIDFNNATTNETLYILPAPYAIDANGNITSCYYEVKTQGQQIWFYVRTPYNWLVNASLPVVVDPTFGNTLTTASAVSMVNTIVGGYFKMGTVGGNGDSITAQMFSGSTSFTVKCAIYNADNSLLANSITEEKTKTVGTHTVTFNFGVTKPVLVANAWYYIVTWANNAGGYISLKGKSVVGAYIYYDAEAYGTFPNPWAVTGNLANYNASIYCTYTETPSASWKSISTWNGTIYNQTLPKTWNTVASWNGTLWNQSQYKSISVWNGTLFNQSWFKPIANWNGTLYNQTLPKSWKSIATWNGTLFNQSRWLTVLQWNGTLFNSSRWLIISTWNGTLYNQSRWLIIKQWNGTVYNQTVPRIVNQWNGTIWNASLWKSIASWNGTLYNSSHWIITTQWNGTLFNQSVWFLVKVWNGTIFNSSIWKIVSIWNGTLWNKTIARTISNWNGTVYNTSRWVTTTTWNGTIYNKTLWNTVLIWNGTIYNISKWKSISTWNGTLWNGTVKGWKQISDWNGCLYNGTGTAGKHGGNPILISHKPNYLPYLLFILIPIYYWRRKRR